MFVIHWSETIISFIQMRIFFNILLGIITINSCLGQEKTKGLIFTPQSELKGIPLASSPFSGKEFPANVDLSNNLPRPGDQGNQASCVGWALGYALKSYQEKIETKKSYYFSPAFIYNQINGGRDGGAKIVDGLNILSQKGACEWNHMEYSQFDYSVQPSHQALTSARKYRIDFWRRVNVRDIKEVKAQINAGYPVVIGVNVDQGFENINKYFKDNVWDKSIGTQMGGHAMLVVGFDNYKQAFKVINSWGTNWGDGGYGWIGYSHFNNVVREGYVAKDAINQEAPGNPIVDPNIFDPPSPTQDLVVTFYNTEVIHNVSSWSTGKGMRINGVIDIPEGVGNNFSIVAYFYFNSCKCPVKNSLDYNYSDIYGNAATTTKTYSIQSGIHQATWTLFIPYNTFSLQSGYYYGNTYYYRRTFMYATPQIFVDGFALATGQSINFYVDR